MFILKINDLICGVLMYWSSCFWNWTR